MEFIDPNEKDYEKNVNNNNTENQKNKNKLSKDTIYVKYRLVIDIIRAIVCRLAALVIYSYSIFFMLCAIPFSYRFSFLVYILPIIIIIIDTLYICIVRKGKEYDWYSVLLCYFWTLIYKKNHIKVQRQRVFVFLNDGNFVV